MALRVNDPVRLQYERHPYPPIPLLALPSQGEGKSLRFETVAGRAGEGIRILVAGCGSFEPLVVAQANPRAAEIVAVDVSEASLKRLRARLAYAKVARFHRRIPKLRLIQADLLGWNAPPQSFDYIVASNLLQHVEAPATLLKKLAGLLKPDGVLRVVTYPKQSRIFMRAVAHWFKVNGLAPEDPKLLLKAATAIEKLSPENPLRATFLTHPERTRPAGLVDAFFHARENPLRPFEWKKAAFEAGLVCTAESQTETSRSSFVEELLPEARALGRWEKLQILDDTLELCANPVLWFKKGPGEAPEALPEDHEGASEMGMARTDLVSGATPISIARLPRGTLLRVPSPIRWEIADGLRRAAAILAREGIPLARWLEALKTEVGPRVSAPPRSEPLPGLSILDYPAEEILSLPKPLGSAERDSLERLLGTGAMLKAMGEREQPPTSLPFAKQLEWIELKYGARKSWIPVQIF